MTHVAAQVGARIRELRLRADVTQAQLGAPGWSASYISLIESGRRPVGPAMLAVLAKRLGCSVRFLETGEPDTEETRLAVDMRAAEEALRSGTAEEARRRFVSALEAAGTLGRRVEARQARWGVARADEAAGALDDAIDTYEQLLADPEPAGPPLPLRVTVALIRCYREAGDLGYAISLGESARADLPVHGGDPGGEIELLAALAGCYSERGDWARAAHLTRVAVQLADGLGERRARRSAYWNASLVAETQGRIGEALALSDQALSLYAEDDDARVIALLRVVHAWLQLRLDPPDTETALGLLRQAEAALAAHGTEAERVYCETEIARWHLLTGDPASARELALRALARVGGHGRVEAARVHLLLAQAEAALGDPKAARNQHRRAAAELADLGATRQAAAAWRELAGALEQAGRREEALAAYRAAVDSAGVAGPWPYPLSPAESAAPAGLAGPVAAEGPTRGR